MTTHTGIEAALLIVNGHAQLSGIAPHGVLVRAGGTLLASGIISGPLTIEPGGHADVSGIISDTVDLAKDAVLNVSGIITGAILRNDGDLRAAVGTVIHGQQLSRAGTFVAPSSDAITISDVTSRFLLHGVGTHLAVVQTD